MHLHWGSAEVGGPRWGSITIALPGPEFLEQMGGGRNIQVGGLSQVDVDKTEREAQEHSRPLNMRTGKVLFCGPAPLAGWDRAPEPLSLLEFRTLFHLSILIDTALDHSVRSLQLPF